jgi:hypothetical protein
MPQLSNRGQKMKEVTEITYDLKSPFEYAFKGDMRNASFITLHAPTVENIGYIAKLKQGFMKAISSQNQSAKAEITPDSGGKQSDDFDDLTGDMIMAMLSMSDIDYAAYMQTARATFLDSGIALIDGEEPLKKGLISKMSVSDLEGMTGEYLKVFILTSALEMMKA